MRLRSGAEERGCDYRGATTSGENEDQTVHLMSKDMTRDSERFWPWFHCVWRTTGPILWHAVAGGYMKVQNWGHTYEGVSTTEQNTKNTLQPGFPGSFLTSQTWGQKNTHSYLVVLGCHPTTIPSHVFLMTHMNFGVHPSKTRETTSTSLFLVSRDVRGTVFSHTLKHLPDMIVIETRIFVHYPPFWFNFWLSWSFYNPHIHISSCSSLHGNNGQRNVRHTHSITCCRSKTGPLQNLLS